jgi:hypothetical protein
MKSTQSDRGLEFDGIGAGPSKGSTKYKHNAWSGHSNDGREVNYPGQQRNGAMASQPRKGTGPSVTKDAYRQPPHSAVPSLPAQGSVRDSINRGSQIRNPGGTRAWDPKAGQNYSGNPDSIRVGQSGGNSYGEISRGRTPVSRGAENFNYGPKKQY